MELKFLNQHLSSHESGFSIPVENSTYKNRSEKEIWIDFKEGSDSALSYIYSNNVNQLFNYGCQINNDEELVCDSIQDLFMDIIRNRKNLADVNVIRFYLFTSLRRKIIKKLKKERSHPTEEIKDQNELRFEITSSPETKMINEQLTEDKCRLINIACQNLTKKQREAILLYFYEGFTYKQLAEIMGMGKVKSARIMIYRTLNVLQSTLSKVKGQLLLLTLLITQSFP